MFAYVPADAPQGAGHAVVTERFVCLLGEECPSDVAVELSRLLELPATTIADVLDVFALHGEWSRVAIAEVLDPVERVVRVAVVGDVVVDLEGASSTRLSAPPRAASFSAETRGATRLRMSLDADGDDTAEAHPIRHGVVRTRRVTLDAAPAAAAAPATPSVVLTLPDGSELQPLTPVVLGRRPWRSTPEETSTAYVVAPSPRREISGIHLEVSIVGGELHARDLDSTNGTLVITPAGTPTLLHDGRSTVLSSGDILDLGEDYRISVGTRS